MDRGDRIRRLERETYRQRRLRDMARVLPVLALILILLPLLWPWGQGGIIVPSLVIKYIFGLWIVVVLAAAILSRLVQVEDTDDGTGDP